MRSVAVVFLAVVLVGLACALESGRPEIPPDVEAQTGVDLNQVDLNQVEHELFRYCLDNILQNQVATDVEFRRELAGHLVEK